MSLSSPQQQQPRVRARLLLVFLSLLQFLIALDVTVVNVALPSIGTEFGADPRQLTWVVVAYTVTGGGLLMLGGRLSDMFGRRRILLLGTLVFGAASLLAGGAWSFPALVIARLLQGVGEALALPAAMATIIMMFPEGPRRARALGIWAAVASSGLVTGFALSGIITELFGWRWIFFIAVPPVIAIIIASSILLPAGTRKRMPLDVPGAALLTATPLLFAFGVVEVSGGEPWALAAIAGSVITGWLFIKIEQRAKNPLVPMSFFRTRPRLMANGATMLLSATLSTSFLLFTFALQQRLRLSPLETGLMLLPLAAALVAAAMLIPRLLSRWGARFCIMAGLASTALAMLAFMTAVSTHASAPWLIPAMVLIATGMGFGIVGLQYVAVSGTDDGDAGIASGVQRAADQLGGSAGVAVYIGIGFAPVFTGETPYIVASTLAIAGLGAAAVIAARIRLPTG